MTEHVPVLCEHVLHGLKILPGQRIIDATIGAAGHAALLLRASAPDGRLLGLDADPVAVGRAEEALHPFGSRATVRLANFRDLGVVAASEGFDRVDAILMDLGLSSPQLSDPARGFSFSLAGPLDMRFNPAEGETAGTLVNHLPEDELARVLWQYGEEPQARRIARSIVAERPIASTLELADLIARVKGRREKIHPATRSFQALRIAVNGEMEALSSALPQAAALLRHHGRLAVISFHSLEDRLVKRYLAREARDCICPPEVPICTCTHRATLRIITRKPIRPSEAEIAQNPRSRSARLRIGERTAPDMAGQSMAP